MMATEEDWDNVEHVDGRTADELTASVNTTDADECAQAVTNEQNEVITDEEYAARILSGAQ